MSAQIENAIPLLKHFINELETQNTNSKEFKDAVMGIGTIIKSIGGRNLDYADFMSMYGRQENNMKKQLITESNRILSVLYEL